jgi:hypothetical protein
MLGDRIALTQNSYRLAIAGIIRSIQARHQESDQDSADQLGCSAATIGNARNEKSDLSPVPMLKIGKEYGLDALQPVAMLIGAKLVPLGAVCSSDRDMPSHAAEGLLFLTKALSDNHKVDDREILDNPEAIEKAARVFETLQQRLNELRAAGRRG